MQERRRALDLFRIEGRRGSRQGHVAGGETDMEFVATRGLHHDKIIAATELGDELGVAAK